MFTGIIEALGSVREILTSQSNKTFWIESKISSRLKIDESLSHNGICLTIEEIRNDLHRVTTISETLGKTNAGEWKINDVVNLEQSLIMNGRLDGHLVQGHVDSTAVCLEKKDLEGSLEFAFSYNEIHAPLLIEKGSICVNGVSLTAFNVSENRFTVAIIPYTMEHTNFYNLKKGDAVNIEFDILGKYVVRSLQLNGRKE